VAVLVLVLVLRRAEVQAQRWVAALVLRAQVLSHKLRAAV
jgi:hypothetical protein